MTDGDGNENPFGFGNNSYFALFVGKNWLYYKTEWWKIGLTPNGPPMFNFRSFNLKAFFIFPFFAFYRKLFLFGSLFLLVAVFISCSSILMPVAAVFIVSLAMMSFCGLYFNVLYFISVRRKIRQLIKEYGHDEYLLRQQIIFSGGTSKFNVLWVFIISSFITGILGIIKAHYLSPAIATLI